MIIVTPVQQQNIDRFAHLIDEFGEPIIEAEIADFCWDAREQEAWIGRYEMQAGEETELDRVAILSRLGAHFHTAIALVDGDGAVHDLIDHHTFSSAWDADDAFLDLQARG